VAIAAEEEIKVIDEVSSMQQQTNERLQKLSNQVNDVYNLIK
jgi:hypothetical protein